MRKKWNEFLLAVMILCFSLLVCAGKPKLFASAGTNDICVKFGMTCDAYTVYAGIESGSGVAYSADARTGEFVLNANGWIVQDDYSQAGRIMNEEALIAYLNNRYETLKGTVLTLLSVEDDGYLYEDGISYLSVLGDSISTLSGVTDAAGYNSGTEGNAARYLDVETRINETGATLRISGEKTWWNQVADRYGCRLLANSSVRGETTEEAAARYTELCADRNVPGEMHESTAPDLIMVYLGTNDYRDSGRNADTFYEDYVRLLQQLCQTYRHASVYCINLTDCYAPLLSDEQFIDGEKGVTAGNWDGTSYRLQHFNEKIALAVQAVNTQNTDERIHVVQLSKYNSEMLKTLNLARDEDMTKARTINCGAGKTWIGLHPNEKGHGIIADAVMEALGIIGERTDGSGNQEGKDHSGWEDSFFEDQTENAANDRPGEWKINTDHASYSADGTELYLDQYAADEDMELKKIWIPVVCVSKRLMKGDSKKLEFCVSFGNDSEDQKKRAQTISIPREALWEAFYQNFHRRGILYSKAANAFNGGNIQYERGGRITGEVCKNYYYIAEYIGVPVNVSVKKNEVLVLKMNGDTEALIDSVIREN